ncbi:MAG: methyltransferase domain-containing protein [Bacteroidetes bacterium]|jgi:16S rRNA (guanine(966)-N(2))-methyltransferase RsmD|nr:methyltransferase domain-containing protein [Bacteroidota bacterium]MBT3423404.1 methyltransferase domain-containing protein [Bacteroidota bacterium]MBT3799521.1 methyltransferase domain-containing protein [Bacteroidota bacterium]MBT3935120.1 methyltransferase domain-containing protein [Bacteroidota bacterium]MBT4338626.1 methyltransferase domain-containing protein [Bacteroidota bacterium]
MRIISGSKKGIVIHPPSGLPIRPTTDFCKESLFNILENQVYFDKISVLDLFAGSGAISFEFASRGSKDVVAVDKFSKCVGFIRSESIRHGLKQIKTFREDCLKYLKRSAKTFDIIFADPPYNYTQYHEMIDLVFGKNQLNKSGMLIIEHAEQINFSDHAFFKEKRKYGQSILSFFQDKTDK